jgi:hypothetical protein
MVPIRTRFYLRLGSQDRLRLVFVERGAASSAEIVGGPELDKMAMVTPHDLTGVNRRERCSHI